MWSNDGHRVRILLFGALILCASAGRPVSAALAAEARTQTLRRSRAAAANADRPADTSNPSRNPATLSAVDPSDWDRVVRVYAGLQAPSEGHIAGIAGQTEPQCPGRWAQLAAQRDKLADAHAYHQLGRWPLAPPTPIRRR